MSTGHGFTSVFTPKLEEYLAFKEAMGFHGTSRVWYLKKFDAWCAEQHRTTFDQDTVEGWVSERLTHCGPYRSWMSYIRDFGRWLQAHGHTEAYVLSQRWKAPFVPAHPYLLSTAEIEAFFAAAAHVRAASPWAWQAVAFFTLMHCCGLRTGEVRALATGDVDLRGGRIDIVSSKGERSRRLPVTDEVVQVLAACDQVSRASFAVRPTFFVSAAGTPVSPASVGVIFHRIWDQAALVRRRGGPSPRPYDLRHHFAYANIERWAAEGKDVAAMLPYLAAYMGHATFESTYYYVHTSPDFMAAYAGLVSSGPSVLPEVGFE